MKLDTLMLADAATATPDGKLFVHGGGITRLTAATLPWTQPQLVIVARFLLEDVDYVRPHELRLSITDPTGAMLMPPAPLEVPPPGPADTAEGEERFMQMALGLASLTFTVEGIYRFDLRVDTELLRSLPLAVIAARLDEAGGMVTAPRPSGR